MCRHNDPYVDSRYSSDAEFLNFSLLNQAEQFHLQFQRQLPDFIQEQRSAIGQLYFPSLVGERAGEGSLNMPEQLRFQQVLRDGATVDGDEGPALSCGY